MYLAFTELLYRFSGACCNGGSPQGSPQHRREAAANSLLAQAGQGDRAGDCSSETIRKATGALSLTLDWQVLKKTVDGLATFRSSVSKILSSAAVGVRPQSELPPRAVRTPAGTGSCCRT